MKSEIVDRKKNKNYIEKSPKGAGILYKTLIGTIVLAFLTRKTVSKMSSVYMNSKLSKKRINKFITKNNIDMSEYPKKEYTSFNDFFTREILKGKTYTVKDLLRDKKLSLEYKNGKCLVFRLTVDDYHRYSFVDDGILIRQKKINGILHTVGPIAFRRYKVFKENQREYSVLETKNFGQVIQMEVGALMVGKIVNHNKSEFKRGEEKGYFLFGGSTVVLLFKENVVEIDDDIVDNSKKGLETKVKLGEIIGKRK